MLGTGILSGTLVPEGSAAADTSAKVIGPQAVLVEFTVNGERRSARVQPRVTLLEALRDHLDLTGAKRVCDRGSCGACTVILDGSAVYSCSVLAIEAQGKAIQTVEGLATASGLHPIQAAFVENDAQQCGFCTSGFVMAIKAMLDKHPSPTPEQIRMGIGGNLCRCGTYAGMRKAIAQASAQGLEERRRAARPRRTNAEGRSECLIINGPNRIRRRSSASASLASTARPKSRAAPNTLMTSSGPACSTPRFCAAPYAHARIVSIDTSEAEKLPGVEAVYVVQEANTEIHWEGDDIVAVAAVDEPTAEDAIRRIKVEYEQLPHLVKEEDFTKIRDRGKPANDVVLGNPDEAFQDPGSVILEGYYGTAVVTHCCLEAHGNVAEWEGENLTVYPSTQAVERVGAQFAETLQIPATNVRTLMQYVGGGFGSKVAVDRWGKAVAMLAKKTGKPVKLMLERKPEQMVAGNRPSVYAKVRLAAKKDGTLTGWESTSWSTGGVAGGGSPPMPYVWQIPHQRKLHTAVSINAGSARAWRAPNHPQGCYVTMCAIEDMAAKLRMDPLDLVLKNIALTGERAELYRKELLKAAELMDWKKRWHPRPDHTPGPVKQGLGLSIHTWGGRGHNSDCRITISRDGSVEVSMCTQDLGTGTRTVLAIVAAETLGLPIEAIKLNIGDNRLPHSGSSGGSTTIGGVSSSTRRAAVNALEQLFAKVAPALGASPEQLEATGGQIRVKNDPSKNLSWKQAAAKLGVTPITAMGQNPGPQGARI